MGPGSRPGQREIVASAPYISFTGLKSQTALQTYLRDLAASSARGLPGTSCPQTWRAQGRPGARCTRSLVCKVRKRTRTRAYRFSGNIRPSLRKGAYGRRKCRQINAVRLLCSHLCRDLQLIWPRKETWGHVDAYRAL